MKRYIVLGSSGMVGSSIARELNSNGLEFLGVNRSQVDLRDVKATANLFAMYRPTTVICAAASVGGILKNNSFPVEMMIDNLRIQDSVFSAANQMGISKLIFLGSSCIYPRDSKQPIREEYLMTGPLEVSNEAYAVAKISGIYLMRAYRRQFDRHWISLMPSNLYGPFDNFNLKSSHVIPALIRKFVDATENSSPYVEVWGRPETLREFLYVDDIAKAILAVEDKYDSPIPLNVGSGIEISMGKLAHLICDFTGFRGDIIFNNDMPSGTPRKLLDSSKINELGWRPSVSLEDGLNRTIDWYRANGAKVLER